MNFWERLRFLFKGTGSSAQPVTVTQGATKYKPVDPASHLGMSDLDDDVDDQERTYRRIKLARVSRMISPILDFFGLVTIIGIDLAIPSYRWDIWKVVVLYFVANNLFIQSRTGQTLGRAAVNEYMVIPMINAHGKAVLCRVSVIRLLKYYWRHIFVDVVSVIGLFRPLWHYRCQNYANKLTGTLVIHNSKVRNPVTGAMEWQHPEIMPLPRAKSHWYPEIARR